MTYSLKVSPPEKTFSLQIDSIASDKSISHRCAIFSLLTDGVCTIDNFLRAQDTLDTLNIVESLGASITKTDTQIKITPPQKLQEPSDALDCGNSGTAIRLLTGFLSAQKDQFFILTGDDSIKTRPMQRVISPLNDNGACIYSRHQNTLAPIAIKGRQAQAFSHSLAISSAQVKSALILFALYAKNSSTITESQISRDHTENLLKEMGADIQTSSCNNGHGQIITVSPLTKPLRAFQVAVPSDPSSGFFFALAVCLVPKSNITLTSMLLNPTRIEAYKVLESMGAEIKYSTKGTSPETYGDITIVHAPLKSINVDSRIAWLIDEVPALAIAFCIAEGTSTLKNAQELRHKESDRIACVAKNIRALGFCVQEFDDGLSITGQPEILHDASYRQQSLTEVKSFGDHRIAMSCAIFGLLRPVNIHNAKCIETSFPNFVHLLQKITQATIDK